MTTHRNNQAVAPTPWLPMNGTTKHPLHASNYAGAEPTLPLGDLA